MGRSANDVPRSPHKKRREKIEGLSREWQHDGDGHYRPVPDGREVHLCRGEKKNERDEWGTPRPGGWPKERKTTKNEGDNKERKRACVPATASDHLLSSANGDLAATEDVQQTAAGTDSPVPRSGPSPGAKQRRRRRKKKKSGGLCLDDNKQEAASSTALATDKNGVEGSAEQVNTPGNMAVHQLDQGWLLSHPCCCCLAPGRTGGRCRKVTSVSTDGSSGREAAMPVRHFDAFHGYNRP